MTETGKDTLHPAPEEERETSTSRAVRWLPSELDRLKMAAEILSAREHINLSTADIIRRGALREAEAILGQAA